MGHDLANLIWNETVKVTGRRVVKDIEGSVL